MSVPFLRSPKTARERREIIRAIQQGVPVRKARMGRNLPTDWDDMPKGLERSWKFRHGRKRGAGLRIKQWEEPITRDELIEAIISALRSGKK